MQYMLSSHVYPLQVDKYKKETKLEKTFFSLNVNLNHLN